MYIQFRNFFSMNIIYPQKHFEEITKNFGIAFVLICISFSLQAQSVIYKKDGSKITTTKSTILTKSISYSLASDSTDLKHFISKSVVDSVRFIDGRTERINISLVNSEPEPQKKLLKNSFGINIWPFFSSKINFFYERLFLQNKLGFKNYFLFDVGKYQYTYGTLNQLATFYYSAGLNYYFLQSYFLRAGTGASILTGKFGNPYWYGYETVKKYTNQTGILLNASVCYIIHKRIYTSIGLEIPVGFDFPDNTPIFRSEISINF